MWCLPPSLRPPWPFRTHFYSPDNFFAVFHAKRREGDKTDDDAVSGDFSTVPHSSAGRDFNLHIDSFAGIGRDCIVLISRETLILNQFVI